LDENLGVKRLVIVLNFINGLNILDDWVINDIDDLDLV